MAMLVCFGSRDAECASVTCAPLQKASDGMLISGMPYRAAAGLCHLGPLLHFKKSASGCCQPPPAGGPPTADLSNYTRRAGRRCPAPPGPVGRRAARGGPGNLPTARAPAAPAGCDTGWPGRAVAAELQPAKRAAGGPKPTPGRRCGPGAACKPVASDWRWATARMSPLDGSCRCVTDPQTALPSTTTALAR